MMNMLNNNDKNKHDIKRSTYSTFQHHQLEKYNEFMLEFL